MPRKLPRAPNEKPQIERFAEAAKLVGAAETDEHLATAIRQVAPIKTTSRPSVDAPRKVGRNPR